MKVPLPHAASRDLDVAKVDDELVIGTGTRRRSLPLPRRIAHLELSQAKLQGDLLLVHFIAASGVP